MANSPTTRTLAFLRAAGHTCAVTEHWNAFIKRRQDLFNFIDVVALHSGESGVLAVQATSGSNHSARLNKILEIHAARLWLEAGNRIWIVSWQKRGERGKVKKWEPRIQAVTLADFADVA